MDQKEKYSGTEGTHYTYDNNGNLVKLEDALGGISLYQYDYVGNKTVEVTPQNYNEGSDLDEMSRTEFTYDEVGRLKKQTNYYTKDEMLTSTVGKTYEYDSLGRITKEADANENGVLFTYHPNGKVATEQVASEQTKAEGEVTKYSYDVFGNLKEITRDNYIKSYTYNEVGDVQKVTDSIGEIASYTYDSLGRQITQEDGNGNKSDLTYNAFGFISSVKSPGDDSIEERITYTQYDVHARKQLEYDTAGNKVEYEYDTRGNIIKEKSIDVTNGDTLSRTYDYDIKGRPISTTKEANTLVTIEYDALDRKIKESLHTKADEQITIKTTSYGYDKNGNIISKTDYLGNNTRYVFDDRDRLVEEYRCTWQSNWCIYL